MLNRELSRFKILPSLILVSLMGLAAAQTPGCNNGKWIDLTHSFDENSVYWPTVNIFKKTTIFEGITDGGYYLLHYNLSAAEHGGTHMDAPIHFNRNRKSTDQLGIEELIGNAAVINISRQSEANRDYQLTVADILAWETQHGRISDGSILLINTGSSKFYHDKNKYMGTTQRGKAALKLLSFPGIHPNAAKLIANKRKIKAVGLDTPSLDSAKAVNVPTHRILFERNIPGFENVANLDALPPTGATVFALPMKIKGGSGGPTRIVAFVPQPAIPNNSM